MKNEHTVNKIKMSDFEFLVFAAYQFSKKNMDDEINKKNFDKAKKNLCNYVPRLLGLPYSDNIEGADDYFITSMKVVKERRFKNKEEDIFKL